MAETREEWQMRCPKCNRSKLISELGGVRYGAASRGKRTLGWCTQCRWFRWAIVEKVKVTDKDK